MTVSYWVGRQAELDSGIFTQIETFAAGKNGSEDVPCARWNGTQNSDRVYCQSSTNVSTRDAGQHNCASMVKPQTDIRLIGSIVQALLSCCVPRHSTQQYGCQHIKDLIECTADKAYTSAGTVIRHAGTTGTGTPAVCRNMPWDEVVPI